VMPAPSAPALVTRWRSFLDVSGAAVETSWPEVFAELKAERPFAGDTEHPGWSPVVCDPPTRKDEHVKRLSALVLDYDGTAAVSAAVDLWGGCYGLIHTTRKHTYDVHRFRVVLPLSRHVNPAEYARLWSWAFERAARVGHAIDASTKNPSRFWYMPGTKPGGVFEAYELAGDPLDVDATLAAFDSKERSNPHPPPMGTPSPSVFDRMKRARAYLAKMDPAISGSKGHQATWEAALVLVRGFDLGASVALDVLEHDYNPRCQPPWSKRELDHKVRTAERNGKLPVGYLLENEQREWKRHAAPPAPEVDHDAEERAGIQDEEPSEATPAPAVYPSWRTPADRARRLGATGVQLPTGFATLDQATRGGFRTGKVVALGGAPGAGKTTLAVNIGLDLAIQGHHVAIIAADEDADGLLIRIGQLLGFQRELLENGDEVTRGLLAERLDEIPTLLLVDADEENATLEQVSVELKRRAAGAPSILIPDSIQTIRTTSSALAEGPRARVDAVVAAMKHAAKVDGHLVLAPCELSRGSYRKADERIDDLAAFKESGGIEYGVAVAVVLRSVPDGDGLVEATIPKNRLGQKLPFRLTLDHRRARFTETTMQPIDEDEEQAERFDLACGKVLAVLSRCTDIRSANGIAKRTGGNKAGILAAVKDLQERGRIVIVDGCFRPVREAS
jgi:RecA/RadA recombinase